LVTISETRTYSATALTAPHRNGLEIGGAETTDGNRRLATLGDVVLKLVTTKDWYLAGLLMVSFSLVRYGCG